jgi:class 3 adenylate cyclase
MPDFEVAALSKTDDYGGLGRSFPSAYAAAQTTKTRSSQSPPLLPSLREDLWRRGSDLTPCLGSALSLAGLGAAQLGSTPQPELYLTLERHSYPGVQRVSLASQRMVRSTSTGAEALASPRSLFTFLLTDIVGSTQTVERLGDKAWDELLKRHDSSVRTQLSLHGGMEVDHAGDGFLIIFNSATRAIRCATSVRDVLKSISIDVRAGIHAGECEGAGTELSGIAVHFTARITSSARPGEILVSQTVRDLVAGSGLEFANGRMYALKGLSKKRRLFALTQ